VTCIVIFKSCDLLCIDIGGLQVEHLDDEIAMAVNAPAALLLGPADQQECRSGRH
jgi:hypothetical protein